MDQAKNLTVVCQYEDGAYYCTIELFDAWSQTWEIVPYVARRGDPAPVNVWIIEQIDTGAYDPIDACPIPPPPPEPTHPAGDAGPVVI